MITLRSFAFLFAGLLLVSIIAVKFGARPSGSVTPEFAVKVSPQRVTSTSEALSVAGSTPSASAIHGPVRIEATPDNHLFLVDDGRHEELSEFSANGRLIQTFNANGLMFRSITDVSGDTGRLWVADLIGSTIHVLNRHDATWKSTKLAKEPYRIDLVGTQENPTLVVTHIGARKLFTLQNADGQVLTEGGDLLEQQPLTSLALDGFIARTAHGFAYSGKYLGLLASFNPDGSLRWAVEPILPRKKPLIVTEDNARRLEHPPLTASESLAASRDLVAVLGRQVNGLSIASRIDIYRADNGDYHRTLMLPEGAQWTSIAMTSEYLFAANERGVYRWGAPSQTQTDSAEGLQLIAFMATKR